MTAPLPRAEAGAADTFDDASLAALFTLVYTGYAVPMHVDGPTMRFMRVAADVDLASSRVLRDGAEPVAVALLGVRGEAGYIAGMGVAPSHRGRGLGEAVMRAVLASARERGVRRVQLEVLVQNGSALRLYERLGFRHVRDLEVWSFPAPGPAPAGAVAGVTVTPATLDDAHAFVRAHRAAPEPWQRADGTLAALRADGAAFEALAAMRDGRTVGAAIVRVAGRASVVQLATLPGEAEAATLALLGALRRDDAPQGVRWLNLPVGHPAAAVVRALGPTLEAKQHEMALALD
jgi:ribosomal protein S18 acetylase RimI-like enzyme